MPVSAIRGTNDVNANNNSSNNNTSNSSRGAGLTPIAAGLGKGGEQLPEAYVAFRQTTGLLVKHASLQTS